MQRKKKYSDLPRNLYQHAQYFKYRNPITKKCHGMGTNKYKAIASVVFLNNKIDPRGDMLRMIYGDMEFYLDDTELDLIKACAKKSKFKINF